MKKAVVFLLCALGGAFVGYLMFRFLGCPTGACPLRSSAVNSVLYGAASGCFIGYVSVKE